MAHTRTYNRHFTPALPFFDGMVGYEEANYMAAFVLEHFGMPRNGKWLNTFLDCIAILVKPRERGSTAEGRAENQSKHFPVCGKARWTSFYPNVHHPFSPREFPGRTKKRDCARDARPSTRAMCFACIPTSCSFLVSKLRSWVKDVKLLKSSGRAKETIPSRQAHDHEGAWKSGNSRSGV